MASEIARTLKRGPFLWGGVRISAAVRISHARPTPA